MKIKIFVFAALSFISVFCMMESCKTSEEISYKPGALLWGENCVRCHNAPSPDAFSDSQWDVIGTHMKIRANLTDDEVKKITEFLKSGN